MELTKELTTASRRLVPSRPTSSGKSWRTRVGHEEDLQGLLDDILLVKKV